jgi:5-aminolevulinate synthase
LHADSSRAQRTDALLDDCGIYVQPINYPTAPRGTKRMRLTPSPLLTDSAIDQLVNALTQLWKACPISSGKFVALAA